MTLVLHWQQWYFIAGIALNLMATVKQRTVAGMIVGAVLSIASICVLFSSGFFTGGMQ